jgi:cyclopropane-fatty-acyl-phospholipid synthase
MSHRTNNAKNITLRLLNALVPPNLTAQVGIRLWDGTLWPDERPRATTVVLNFPGALRTIFGSGNEMGLGEGYLRNEFDIEGSIEDVLLLADTLGLNRIGIGRKLVLARLLLQLPKTSAALTPRAPAQLSGQRHSPERDRQAVAYHYNASNQFYALWLDPQMVYSCAYFEQADDELAVAQTQKLDLICRKLRLRPGQKLLDLGCGWGALVIHAAKYFGVDATGITLSRPQVEWARRRITEENLAERCRVLECDYREVAAQPTYDAVASVGMFEHVGTNMLPEYFERAYALLQPAGVFLNHGIALNGRSWFPGKPVAGKRNFIDTYVFPDGETVPLNYSLQIAEESGFEVRDVESLRDHYVLTTRAWVRRLEQQHQHALRMVDEATFRVWRLYLASSTHGFKTNRITVFQTLLAKPDARGNTGLPLTRHGTINAASAAD